MRHLTPVYYGGDLFDSEDSERDDPYALASAVYVEDYNYDVPEGMDLMVHHRSQISDGSETQRDDQTDMVPVCQTVSCVTRNGWARLGGYLTEIKVLGLSFVLSGDMEIALGGVCVCPRSTAGGLLRGKDFAHTDWLPSLCGRFGKLL